MSPKSLSLFACVAALSASLCGSASAAALLTRHVPEAVAKHQAALAGSVDPSTPMRMQVVLPMRDKEGLKDLLGVLYNPASPLYRHWLGVAEFTKRFGPSERDYNAAIAYFRG
jgi:subtilase family serine protease